MGILMLFLATTQMKWFEGHGYFNLFTIIENRGGSYRWNQFCELEADVNNKHYIFIPESPVINIDGKYINLPLSIKLYNDTLYFPEAYVDTVFGKSEVVITKPGSVRIYGYRIKGNDKKVVVTINITGKFDYYDNWTDMRVYEIKIKGKLMTKVMAKGLIRSVEVSESGGYTVFSFHLKDRSYIYLKESKNGIQLTFERKTNRVKKIVIDPGHGGMDAGAIGPGGTKEKNINLELARLLYRKLKKAGYDVYLTRNSDVFIPLSQRTKFANKKGADLFISIHCNANRNKKIRGMEVYFLSHSRTTWERAVAMRENASIRFERKDTSLANLSQVELILADMAQNYFLKESSRLAELIVENATKVSGLKNKGPKQAGFYVLRGSYMPAVLIETGFISNPAEEKLLNDPSFRKKVIDGVYKGIIKFIEEYERK